MKIQNIDFAQFKTIDLRVGTVVSAEYLENARQPAIVMEIDFGDLGLRKSSAQITKRYSPESILHQQVIALVNIPPVQIGQIMSECLVLGAVPELGDVSIIAPHHPVPNGTRIA